MRNLRTYIMYGVSIAVCAMSLTGCSKFFETDSEYVIFADENHLNNSNDSVYSMIGILNKLQAIGDRTILFGEARGDLVEITEATSHDLREIALFEVNDTTNKYNVPGDYYAVINNCNYFIENVDTALRNNRNESLFMKEYAAVKAIRAWTYLQLAITYGKVPFVVEPILNKEDAEKDYPKYGIEDICEYFLNDGLQAMAAKRIEYPDYGVIGSSNSKMYYIPLYVILGDLNLWAGHYLEAAKCYYDYINTRNGTLSIYPTGTSRTAWMSHNWTSIYTSFTSDFYDETYSQESEIISIIPGDADPSGGYFSELPDIFNTSSTNNYKPSLVPSKQMIDLSAKQRYCYCDEHGKVSYPPLTMSDYLSGDLRLMSSWTETENSVDPQGNKYTKQYMYKFRTGNNHIYRRQLIYLRLAEALNRAGYPHFAFSVLSTGVNSTVMSEYILPNYPDDTNLNYFQFPATRYGLYDPTGTSGNVQNTMGIHSRGSGFSPLNEYYPMPYNNSIVADYSSCSTHDDSLKAKRDSAQIQIAYQIEAVEDLIVDEEALEFAFEGYRFYDLMRVALRRGQPAYLAEKIMKRSATSKVAQIKTDLTNPDNWYIRWNGQIGIY